MSNPMSSMSRNGITIISQGLQGIMELFYFFPLVVITHFVFLPALPFEMLYAALTLAMFAGGILGKLLYRFPLTNSPLAVTFLSVLFGGAAIYLVGHFSGVQIQPWAWGSGFLPAALFFRGFRLAPSGWAGDIPIEFFWVSFGLTGVMLFITLIIPHISDTDLYPRFLNVLLPYQSLMLPAVLFALLFNLLFNNVRQIRHVSYLGKSMASLKDMIYNQMWTLGIIALIGITYTILYLANISIFGFNLSGGTSAGGALIGGGFAAVGGLIGAGGGSSGSGSDSFELWGKIGDVTLYVGIAAIVIAILLIFDDIRRIALWLIRNIKNMLIQIWRWLMSREKRNDTGFEDETTSLNAAEDLAQSAEQLKQWLQDRFRQDTRWNDLTNNRERIRYLYSRLILRAMSKGFDFRSARTPHETVHDLQQWERVQTRPFKRGRGSRDLDYTELSEIYNRVRYGSQEVGDEEVSRMKEKYGD